MDASLMSQLKELQDENRRLKKLVCSMSAVGYCGYNAACDEFFGLLKRQRIYHMTYPTLDAGRADVFEDFERRHNPRMRRRTAREDLKFSTLSQPSVISCLNPVA
jgi:putative transposase